MRAARSRLVAVRRAAIAAGGEARLRGGRLQRCGGARTRDSLQVFLREARQKEQVGGVLRRAKSAAGEWMLQARGEDRTVPVWPTGRIATAARMSSPRAASRVTW